MDAREQTKPADDAALLMRFVRELAIYEKAEHEVLATEEDLRRDIFGPGSRVEALICERGGEPIGHAIFFMNYSTWLGRYGIFLEELYITPELLTAFQRDEHLVVPLG